VIIHLKRVKIKQRNYIMRAEGGVFMKIGIREKVIGIISILIILSVASLGIFSYINSADVLSDSLRHDHFELNKEIAEAIDNQFEGYMSGLKMVADNGNTKTISEVGFNQWRRDLFKTYVDNFEQVTQAFIGLPDGTIHIEPQYEFADDYDPRQRAWYKGVMENNGPYWTDVYLGAVSKKWTIAGAVPSKDTNGNFQGVLSMSIILEELADEISQIKVGKDGYVFILGRDGTVISHPDESRIGSNMDQAEIQQAIAKEDSGTIDYSFTNSEGKTRDKYVVYQKIDSLGWYVMTSMYVDEITDKTAVVLRTTLIVAIIVLILAIVIGVLFGNSMIKPIKQIVADMKLVEAGDMTVQSNVRTKDEIGDLSKSFNAMVENVRSLVKNASTVTDNVAESAESLAAASEEASASSEEVSRTVEEIARGASDQANDAETSARLTASLDEKLNKLHDNSKDISTNALSAKDVNEKGLETVGDLREKSDENIKSTEEIAESISELEKKSNDIGGILETISSIAEQTNLLALNASIEAARAGEHGKGFAVVADEIRKLAEESSSSADKIRNIVDMIQKQTKDTVSIMDRFKENSEKQFGAVQEVDGAFANISNSIDEIVEQISLIDEFIEDIIGDKNEIVTSITNISSVSEETAAASEEVSASMQQQSMAVESVAQAAETLNELSIELKSQIGQFKI
jgi:methyl-accepting chemotaxis protein